MRAGTIAVDFVARSGAGDRPGRVSTEEGNTVEGA